MLWCYNGNPRYRSIFEIGKCMENLNEFEEGVQGKAEELSINSIINK